MCSPSAEFPSSFKDCSWSPPTPTTRLPPTRSEYKGRINGDHPRYPRVVVRDSLGNKLDTFTYLQEAIYRAEWNVKNSHEAVLPEEWRLPKAPNPARPDYSRTAPVLASVRGRLRSRWDRTQDVSRSVPNARLHEIDVGDVAFVAESLNQLPRVPSLSFLHHDLLAEPKRYFQIVNQAIFQRRYFAQTDKRERVYNFPGFCTGCRRSGLCYGCERSSEPHYHVDRIMKTGGGFTYHRHDRPIREQMGKNPSNWKLAFPELALKHLIKEHKNGSVSLSEEDEELACKPDIAGRHNESFNQKASNDTGYPNTDDQEMEEESVGTQEEIVKQWALMREEQLTGDNKRGIVQDKNQNQSRISQENMDAMSPWKDTSLGNKEVIDESLYRGESHLSTGSQDITIPRHTQETDDSKDNASSQESQQLHDPVQDQDLDHTVEQEDHSDTSDKTEQLLENPVDVQNQTDNDADSEENRDLYPRTKSQSRGDTSSDKTGRQENRSEESGSSPYSPYSNKRRQPLYKDNSTSNRSLTPPPFKVKHRKNRLTESRSPFSSDRKYDLPTGSGFQVKKSEKKLTEFKEFKHHEGEWKEPEKFTVKKAEKATTEFWSAPKKKEAKKKPRVKKEEKRPVSPDSGLESEKPTDSAQELPLKTPAIIEAERVLSPPLQRISSPEPPRKERPKKTKKEAPPRKPPSPIRSLTPKSPEPVFEEVAVTLKSREPTPEHVPTPTPKVLELPPVDIPPLPDIVMEEKKEKKPKVSNRKLVEPIQVMPKVKDALPPPPKKSKPPPIMKKSTYKKRIPSAEAPVTTEEIRQMKDPLDFLAKYCIISKDRLPYYERIYKNVVSSQPERYEREHPLSPTTGMPVTEGTSWGKHELNMFHDLITISRGQEPKRPGLSGPEQYLEKICYTLRCWTVSTSSLQGTSTSWRQREFSNWQRVPGNLYQTLHPSITRKRRRRARRKRKRRRTKWR
uniref:Cyclin-dependent kinase 12-like n=1 Tax=Crassostrea virginica TaxID=6565 RepID=A0A8B8AYE3_CRAVI|nr:cyclin-dependent kinase 12-like [Crassostrea virginica]